MTISLELAKVAQYVSVNTSSNVVTSNATLALSGSSSSLGTLLLNAAETTNVSATAANSTMTYYLSSQSVMYLTTNAAANWNPNVAFSSGTTLNTALTTNQAITFVMMVTQGTTAYYSNTIYVDGTQVTPKWQGGSAPTAGNASGVDIYTYTIIKTASATFTVFASQTQFK
jgi:hypothetical protein